jgi:hypothetical protein
LRCPPPPQVWPAGHAPQFSNPPQPSAIIPQSKPHWAQLTGPGQSKKQAVPKQPGAHAGHDGAHVNVAMQVPQSSV